MNARLLFILLLFTIGALWYIIGYWRRKAGEAAFAAARLTEKSEERERYCRLAVMAGHREACRMFCLLHPERFDGHSPHKPFKLRGIRISFTDITIRHDTMRYSMMNRGLSAIPSTSSNKEIYTESSSLKRV